MTANIKTFRERRGISQAELARLLSVSQQTVSGWERGAKNPRLEKLPSLANLLGCSIADLITEEESK